jgi:membrane-associated phospholipid phosphatase
MEAMIGALGIDRTVLDWFVAHREPWLSRVFEVVTVLGSSVFLIPLVVAAGVWYRRRQGTIRPFALLAVTYLGAYVMSQSLKVIIGRPRPPVGVAIGQYSSHAFPSGHATQVAAVWLMLAAVVTAGMPSSRQRLLIWAAATSTVAVVGITRLYLGAHWLTDVLGGWAFGTLWFLSVLSAARIGRCAPSPSTPTGSPS